MRITQNMLNNTMMRNLNQSLVRMDRLQDMLASGKKISKPSHDPVIASRGMLYRTTISENEQFRANTGEAVDWLTATETAIDEARNVLARVKELITQASNDTVNQGDREKIRDEIIQLREHLGNVANTTLKGRYLFSGTDTDKAPFNNGVYTNQNNQDINLEVSQAILVPMNVGGIQLFGQQKSGIPDMPILTVQGTSTQADQNKYEEAWKTDLFAMMNKLIEELKPSEYATDQYGRVLAADADGRPLFDADGKAILYDGSAGQTKLKNESFVRDADGHLLAADKVTGEPIMSGGKVELYDPANPAHVPLKKNTSGNALLAYDKNDATVPKSIVLYDPANPNHVPLPQPENKMAPTNGEQMSGYLDVIQKHIDNFLQVQAQVGSRINRLELIQDRLDTQNLSLQNIMSEGEDADMAEVIMNLQNNENVYRAALASGSRIIQPTLLDFLR